MTAASWPRTLLIPAVAASQWQALRVALAVTGTPCASDPELWHSRDLNGIAAASDARRTCHAFTACGEYADAAGERLGVWAGVDRTKPRPERGDVVDAEDLHDHGAEDHRPTRTHAPSPRPDERNAS